MKKLLLTLFSLCALNCNAQHLYGDVNHDGKISVADVDMLVNIVLGRQDAERIQIKDGEIYEAWKQPNTTYYIIDEVDYPMPEEVDLGLPSGTKWASTNLQSNDGESLKFAWGENFPKKEFTKDNYSFSLYHSVKTVTEQEVVDLGYSNGYPTYHVYRTFVWTREKYNLSEEHFPLSSEYKSYDPVIDIIGDGWSLPTEAQFAELFQYCILTEEYVNGQRYFKYTGPSGKYIYVNNNEKFGDSSSKTYTQTYWFAHNQAWVSEPRNISYDIELHDDYIYVNDPHITISEDSEKQWYVPYISQDIDDNYMMDRYNLIPYRGRLIRPVRK